VWRSTEHRPAPRSFAPASDNTEHQQPHDGPGHGFAQRASSVRDLAVEGGVKRDALGPALARGHGEVSGREGSSPPKYLLPHGRRPHTRIPPGTPRGPRSARAGGGSGVGAHLAAQPVPAVAAREGDREPDERADVSYAVSRSSRLPSNVFEWWSETRRRGRDVGAAGPIRRRRYRRGRPRSSPATAARYG